MSAPSGGIRHAGIDRLFHWVTAAAVLILLCTAFLPIAGLHFSWVGIHWITGIVLIVAVAFHLLRSLFWQSLRSMWIGSGDFRSGAPSGKYSLAQKLMHHVLGLAVLTAVVTGALMLAKVDTPWWHRNPYWLSAGTWGVVYVLHGLAALAAVTLVMIHIYFSLLPEKRAFLRAMLRGHE
ncbi:MAG TPA: cytochrome b/b6 domain-containing protein [Steroidobacteraceae bacterium]|nr:cytochrome b/b6 domain-containing protein [Steroidobacteraceae bacterium]